MGRSNWRLNFISKSLISRVIKHQLNIKYKLKDLIISNKSSIIPDQMNKVTAIVLKGSKFRLLKINKYNIGWKFGEFVLTRKPNIFYKKQKK